MADTNLLSNLEDEVGNDNHVFFLNLAPPPPAAVPTLGGGAAWLLIALLLASGLALRARSS
ncbi:MAG: hypothetical protein QNK04_06035 [Myxococcota bacterium]|nr:hypothetical protein [Myxococcota bacterium]